MEQSILTKEQRDFLTCLAGEEYLREHFYLTGGTALAEYYLHHRLSEDLDFFSADTPLPFNAIDACVRTYAKNTGAQTEMSAIHDRRRFFLRRGDDFILKIEFVLYQFPSLKAPEVFDGLNVDTFDDIAANKIMAMTQRCEAKDFVDLYFIMTEKGYTIYDLLELARKKFSYHFDPIWVGSELAKVHRLPHLPNMIKGLDMTTLKKFFEEESLRLKPTIFQDIE